MTERLQDEPLRPWRAFGRWLEENCPPLASLAAELGVHHATVKGWSSRYRWVERATARDTARLEAVLASDVDEVRDMRARHLAVARKGMQVAARELDALLARPAGTVPLHVLSRLLEVSSRLEQLSMGEPTERTASTWNFAVLDVDELRAFRQLSLKASAGELPAPQVVAEGHLTPTGVRHTPEGDGDATPEPEEECA